MKADPCGAKRGRKSSRAKSDNAERELAAALRVLAVLKRRDALRAELMATPDALLGDLVNQPDFPATIRAEFDRFWRAGGCTAEQWRTWLAGRMARERVKTKRGLRLVVENRRRRAADDV